MCQEGFLRVNIFNNIYFRLNCNTIFLFYRPHCAESNYVRFDQMDHSVYNFACCQLCSYQWCLFIVQVMRFSKQKTAFIASTFFKISQLYSHSFFKKNIYFIHCLVLPAFFKTQFYLIFTSLVYIFQGYLYEEGVFIQRFVVLRKEVHILYRYRIGC